MLKETPVARDTAPASPRTTRTPREARALRKPRAPRKTRAVPVLAPKRDVRFVHVPKLPKKKTIAHAEPKSVFAAQGQLRGMTKEYAEGIDSIRRMKQRMGNYRMQDGTVRPSPFDLEQKERLELILDKKKESVKIIEQEMLRLLDAMPIYTLWLRDISGIGLITASVLCANIDIFLSEKPSNLKQFCGLSVDAEGRAMRARAGIKNPFSSQVKTALYQGFTSLMKATGARRIQAEVRQDGDKYVLTTSPLHVEVTGRTVADVSRKAKKALLKRRPDLTFEGLQEQQEEDPEENEDGAELEADTFTIAMAPASEKITGSKYLKRMAGYKHRLMTSPRYKPEDNTFDGRKGGRAIVTNMTWRPGAQLFLYDLYVVWRTLEGLPVWPEYADAKQGIGHGAVPCINEPSLLTVEQALERTRRPCY